MSRCTAAEVRMLARELEGGVLEEQPAAMR